MNNEDYGLIGDCGNAGCTAEQLEYHAERVRADAIFRGRTERPWASMGFKLKAKVSGSSQLIFTKIDEHTRFVPPNLLDVVTMTRRQPRYGHAVFPVLLQVGYSDQAGLPCLGGTLESLRKEADFAIGPVQDHQMFIMTDRSGHLKYTGAPGLFVVRRSELHTDLCVGRMGTEPLVIYRFYRGQEDSGDLEIAPSDIQVQSGYVLATLHKTMRFGQISCNDDGPIVMRIGGQTLSAKRFDQTVEYGQQLFRMLNQMNRTMNDMVLLPQPERPHVVPIEHWAPRIMVAIPANQANRITGINGYRHTEFLRDEARRAISPDGSFSIRAKYSGLVEKVETARRQPHLKRIYIGGQFQSVVASAVLLDNIEEGVTVVEAGQPIADVCRRIHFASWQEVCDFMDVDSDGNAIDLPNADWVFLPEFLEQQLIRPGEQGWTGPETLIDIRCLNPGMIQRGWRWFYDLAPCLPYLNQEEGTIVCPPFPHRSWNDVSISVNGITYVFATRADLSYERSPRVERAVQKRNPRRFENKKNQETPRPEPKPAAKQPPIDTPIEQPILEPALVESKSPEPDPIDLLSSMTVIA